MRIAIIAALPAEADAFMPSVGSTVRTDHHLIIRTLDHAGHSIRITSCGIGKVNAACAATLLAAQADLLMIIGTAGKLGNKMGDCFVLTEALQSDYGATRTDGFVHYVAGDVPIGPATLTPFRAFTLPDIGLPQARIASGDSFIECPDHSLRLVTALNADLVDMETAAVAQVAAKLGLPWAGIKATTDDANGSTASDFRANLAHAARLAAHAAERTIALM